MLRDSLSVEEATKELQRIKGKASRMVWEAETMFQARDLRNVLQALRAAGNEGYCRYEAALERATQDIWLAHLRSQANEDAAVQAGLALRA